MVIIPASIHLKVALTDWHFAQTNNRARRTQMAANRYTIPKLMELQPVILELQTAMNAVDGATIEPRIRISQPDEGWYRDRARSRVCRCRWEPSCGRAQRSTHE
jgi:hypothetical protein